MNPIEYDGGALNSLRQRVAEVEEMNEDLVAFARGQSSAVAAIHDAVLAALAARSPEALGMVVTCRWPMLLKVDEAALFWSDGTAAFHADANGFRAVESRLVARMADHLRPVTMRAVGRGHPVFGAQAAEMRSEALIRLDGVAGCGLIALGQRRAPAAEGLHGARLLRFLGRSVSHMLEQWPAR
ncbi:DUF484 family protein [Sphingomonas sp.]|uniref:DUF484 family protein n=1 Tax=Sphingomonas sp. TaxID=28214 RepID=UPI003B3B0590